MITRIRVVTLAAMRHVANHEIAAGFDQPGNEVHVTGETVRLRHQDRHAIHPGVNLSASKPAGEATEKWQGFTQTGHFREPCPQRLSGYFTNGSYLGP